MGTMDCLALLRNLITFISPILYIVSFASKSWVLADRTEWGLWSWCYTNSTKGEQPECHTIAPGDSPAYYEAVRTFATFTLVPYVFHWFTFDEKKGMGKGNNPLFLFTASIVGVVTTVGVLADHYRSDERWKDLDPSLGWCFWLLVSCGLATCLVFGLTLKVRQIKNKSSAVSQDPNANRRPQRRPSTASSLSLDRGRKITIFRTSAGDGACASAGATTGGLPQQHPGTEPPASSTNAPPSSPPSDAWGRLRRDGGGGGGAGFPLLSLPRYEIPPEPGTTHPVVPPPSYEDVVRRDGGSMSPPPVYTVTGS